MSDRNIKAVVGQTEATEAQLALLFNFKEVSAIPWNAGLDEKLREKLNLSADDSVMLYEQLLVYLWLHEICPEGLRISPPPTIDAAWHEFLAFTLEYQKFCDVVVGKMIHHTPFTSRNRQKLEAIPRWLPVLGEMKCFIGQDIIVDRWWYKPNKIETQSAWHDGECA